MMLAVVKGKGGRGQRSTSVRGSRGGSARAKASTQSKPRPRKRSKVGSCCAWLAGSTSVGPAFAFKCATTRYCLMPVYIPCASAGCTVCR